MAENLSDKSTTQPVAPQKDGTQDGVGNPADADVVDKDTYKEMLDILQDLTDHTHIFFDDYSTACNCNCNCTCCIRGMVW